MTIEDLAKVAHRAGQDAVGRPIASWPKDDALSVGFYPAIVRAVVLALPDEAEILSWAWLGMQHAEERGDSSARVAALIERRRALLAECEAASVDGVS